MKKFPEKQIGDFIAFTMSKWQVKLAFAIVAFSIMITIVGFTNTLVNEMIAREKNSVDLYAKIFQRILNMQYEESDFSDADFMLFFSEQVTATVTFPIIFTNENDQPTEPFDQWALNLNFKPNTPIEKQRKIVAEYMESMKENYEPIIVTDKDGKVIAKIYYTHSTLVDKLRFYPVIALIGITLFVVFGYFSFSSTRKHEQSKVWVGMAKEAAHQLGTPLSSMLAWLEIMKSDFKDEELTNEAIREMENDVKRLNTIAIRFSKIGSMPDKEILNLSDLIENVCVYFDRRLPHLGKKIEISRALYDNVQVKVNNDLFAWVIENLLKNGAEAIEEKQGEISISMKTIPNKKVYIFIRDTGKGMSQKIKRQIFYPGFSTKKRGWGLGLSLCKRIIEEYHSGKIYVKETAIGKGTTFVIEIPFKQH